MNSFPDQRSDQMALQEKRKEQGKRMEEVMEYQHHVLQEIKDHDDDGRKKRREEMSTNNNQTTKEGCI